MKAALEPAAKEAGIPATLVDAFAHMLLASLSEIALLIAEADDASSALENGKGAVRELLENRASARDVAGLFQRARAPVLRSRKIVAFGRTRYFPSAGVSSSIPKYC